MNFAEKARDFFISKGLDFTIDELYVLFGVLLSDDAFGHYLNLSGIPHNIDLDGKAIQFPLRKTVRLKEIDKYSLIDLGFFYRHKEFKESFLNLSEMELRDINVNTYDKKITHGYWGLKKFNLMNYGLRIKQRIIFILANSKFFKYSGDKVSILGSAHGIYSDIGAFWLYLAKKTSGDIVISQPGLIHLQAEYIYQVKYELKIATSYVGWGGIEGEKIKTGGSMYSCRGGSINNRDGALIILPQVPSPTPRPFSHYWACYSDFEKQIPFFLNSIREAAKHHDKVVLRCKHCDENYYQAFLRQNNIRLKLEAANVNEGDHFDRFDFVYILNFATAITEAYYKKSNLKFSFSKSSYLLKKEVAQANSFFHDDPTNESKLSAYINTFSKPTTPEDYASFVLKNVLGKRAV